MGQARSKLEDAKRELALAEARGGDSAQVISRLSQLVRLALVQGRLQEALDDLNAILEIQQDIMARHYHHLIALETAQTMFFIGNTIRLMLANDAARDIQHSLDQREALFYKAQDMLTRSLEIRSSAPISPDTKLALVSKTKSMLALLLHQFSGNEDAIDLQTGRRFHEEALEGFAQVPLLSDPMMWTYQKNAWVSRAPAADLSAVVTGSLQPHQRHLSASSSNPTTTATTSRPTSLLHPLHATKSSFSSMLFPTKSNQQLLQDSSSNNLLTRPAALTLPDEYEKHGHRSGSQRRRSETSPDIIYRGMTQFQSTRASAQTLVAQTPKASWRLVLRSSSSSGGGASNSLLRRLSGNGTSAAGSNMEGVLRIIDLEPGKTIVLGLLAAAPTTTTTSMNNAHIVQIAPKNERFASLLADKHCTLHEQVVGEDLGTEDDFQQQRWVITDTSNGTKKRGVVVNKVRISTSPLRVGDVVQLGNCGKTRIGEFAKPSSGEFLGLEYEVQRIVSAVDTGDVNSLAPPKLFPGEDSAFQYFHVCCVAAQVNLKGQPLRDEYIREMFAGAIKSGIPYYQWDSYVFAELARARLLL